MIKYNQDKSFIVISFIKMKDLPSLKKAMAKVPRGIEIISYLEIYNKLLKKEDHYNEPSETLISAYIIKQLNTLLADESTTHLCYVLDIADNNTDRLLNIMEFITEKSSKPVIYELFTDDNEIIQKTKKLNINSFKYEIL